MATKLYLHDVDLDNNKLTNARHHPLTTTERTALGLLLGSADEGRLVYDSTIKTIFYWKGDEWVSVVNDKTYAHTQTTPAISWTILHNLVKFPSVTIVDTNNDEVIGDIKYVDENTVVLTFSIAFSGKAFFN